MFKYIIITVVIVYLIFIINNPFYLSDKMKNDFYNLMSRFDMICKEHDIQYFMVAGTLLGCVRHGEMIPWDNDIDVGILERQFEKFKSIDFSKYGLQAHGIEKGNTGKITFADRLNNNIKYKGVFIDIFFMGDIDGKYQYLNTEARSSWPNEFFYKDEIFPLKRYKFKNTTINGPSKCKAYCRRAWGKNWNYPPIRPDLVLLYPHQYIKSLYNFTYQSRL
jgi:phosphorylcholine metabolism protein LicD